MPIVILCFVFPPLGFTLLGILILAGILNLAQELWSAIREYAIANPWLSAIIIISILVTATALFVYQSRPAAMPTIIIPNTEIQSQTIAPQETPRPEPLPTPTSSPLQPQSDTSIPETKTDYTASPTPISSPSFPRTVIASRDISIKLDDYGLMTIPKGREFVLIGMSSNGISAQQGSVKFTVLSGDFYEK